MSLSKLVKYTAQSPGTGDFKYTGHSNVIFVSKESE